jgi:hypothetical protein
MEGPGGVLIAPMSVREPGVPSGGAVPVAGDPQRLRHAPWLVLLCAVLVQLPACLNRATEATPPGRGVVVLEVAAAAAGRERFDGLDRLGLADPSVEVEQLGDGGGGLRLTVGFDDPYDLPPLLAGGATIRGREVRMFERFELLEVDGEWRLGAVANPLDEMVLFDADRREPRVSRDAEPPSSPASPVSVSIRLPGEIARSNAASTDGGTAVWPLHESDHSTQLWMRTQPKGSIAGPVLLAAAAGAALVLLAFRSLRRPGRRPDVPRGEDTPEWETVPPSSGPDDTSVLVPEPMPQPGVEHPPEWFPVPAWAEHPPFDPSARR